MPKERCQYHSVSFQGLDRRTEYDRSDRSEHEHQRYSPRNLRSGFIELFAQLAHGQGDGEEVESVPRPGDECNQEKKPLLKVQCRQQLDRVWSLGHRRL